MSRTHAPWLTAASLVAVAGLAAGCSGGAAMTSPTPSEPATARAPHSPRPEAPTEPSEAASLDPAQVTEALDPLFTADGRAYAALRAGDSVAKADYPEAIRAGLALYRHEDGSALVVEPGQPLPQALLDEVAAMMDTDHDFWALNRSMSKVKSALSGTGTGLFIVVPHFDLTRNAFVGYAVRSVAFTDNTPGRWGAATVEEAIAEAMPALQARPDIPLIGVDGQVIDVPRD
ncbi:hypothetical protein [Xylanimonas ulmi]|uniref:Lipoprotein n=1 Tax=Xylanimonas ulmi TaxID=228973 RepID=A0A4Q7M8J1_9MICO|nr:hypothetical protein [Xylanibacterium ulmi]RZS62479.1 hypothetical protein EV386_2815 [Xylanibacterium ulmi]